MINLSVGIALPLPVRPEKIGMNVFPRIPNPCEMRENIKAVLKHGPNLHVIPLYSKLLVSKKKFMNKFSWRISCSGIEKHVFDKYPETSGVKVRYYTVFFNDCKLMRFIINYYYEFHLFTIGNKLNVMNGTVLQLISELQESTSSPNLPYVGSGSRSALDLTKQ